MTYSTTMLKVRYPDDDQAQAMPIFRWFVVLSVASLLASCVDLPVARWFLDGNCEGPLHRLMVLSEAFAHGYGVAIVILIIYCVDVARRPWLPQVAAASLGAGLLTNVFKLVVARVRPEHFDFHQRTADTFTGWFPLIAASSNNQSFPSSHAATAAGFAVALAWLYPRGRWIFLALAVLAAGQRLETGAHFLSDVLFGAAIGCLIGGLSTNNGWAHRAVALVRAGLDRAGRGEIIPPCGSEIEVGAGQTEGRLDHEYALDRRGRLGGYAHRAA